MPGSKSEAFRGFSFAVVRVNTFIAGTTNNTVNSADFCRFRAKPVAFNGVRERVGKH